MVARSCPSCSSSARERPARTKSRVPAAKRQMMIGSSPACHSESRVRMLVGPASSAFPSKNEPDPANGVKQLCVERVVDLATETCHRHVDHVVERGGTDPDAPDISREHLARHDMAEVSEQITPGPRTP